MWTKVKEWLLRLKDIFVEQVTPLYMDQEDIQDRQKVVASILSDVLGHRSKYLAIAGWWPAFDELVPLFKASGLYTLLRSYADFGHMERKVLRTSRTGTISPDGLYKIWVVDFNQEPYRRIYGTRLWVASMRVIGPIKDLQAPCFFWSVHNEDGKPYGSGICSALEDAKISGLRVLISTARQDRKEEYHPDVYRLDLKELEIELSKEREMYEQAVAMLVLSNTRQNLPESMY